MCCIVIDDRCVLSPTGVLTLRPAVLDPSIETVPVTIPFPSGDPNGSDMVRTKADRVQTKAVGGKAPTSKAVANAPVRKVTNGGKGKSYSPGNPYHPRETPEWQKPITCFLDRQRLTPDSAGAPPATEAVPPNPSAVGAEPVGD